MQSLLNASLIKSSIYYKVITIWNQSKIRNSLEQDSWYLISLLSVGVVCFILCNLKKCVFDQQPHLGRKMPKGNSKILISCFKSLETMWLGQARILGNKLINLNYIKWHLRTFRLGPRDEVTSLVCSWWLLLKSQAWGTMTRIWGKLVYFLVPWLDFPWLPPE